MTSLHTPALEPDDFTDESEIEKTSTVKDSRSKQKYEARKRIDDILEQKRLQRLLDDWDFTDD